MFTNKMALMISPLGAVYRLICTSNHCLKLLLPGIVNIIVILIKHSTQFLTLQVKKHYNLYLSNPRIWSLCCSKMILFSPNMKLDIYPSEIGSSIIRYNQRPRAIVMTSHTVCFLFAETIIGVKTNIQFGELEELITSIKR